MDSTKESRESQGKSAFSDASTPPKLYALWKSTTKESPALVSYDQAIGNADRIGMLWGFQDDFSLGTHFFDSRVASSDARHTEPARYWLAFDLDANAKKGITGAQVIAETRRLVQELEDHGLICGEDFRVYFSGRRGFKIFFSTLTPAQIGWHKAVALYATRLVQDFPSLDLQIYDNTTLRGPWAKHSEIAAAWQTEVSRAALFADHMTLDAFRALAARRPHPASVNIPDYLPSTNEPKGAFLTFVEQIYAEWEADNLLTVNEPVRPSNLAIDVPGILDAAGLHVHREKERGFVLKRCPSCGRADQTAFVSHFGKLTCKRSSCAASEANGGLSLRLWAHPLLGDELSRFIHRVEDEDIPRTDEELAELTGLTPRPEPLPISEAREKLRRILSDHEALISPGKRTLIRATPGLGKTVMTARETVKPLVEQGKWVLFCVGTLQAVADTYRIMLDAGIPRHQVTVFEGRRDHVIDEETGEVKKRGNCYQAEACNTAAQKGLNATKAVCLNCPYHPSNAGVTGFDPCGYQMQATRLKRLRDDGRGHVVITTFDTGLRLHSETVEKIPADLLILDECPTRPLIKHVTFTTGDEEIDGEKFPALKAFRTFLDTALEKAEERSQRDQKKRKGRFFRGVVNRASDLLRWLTRMAKGQGSDLTDILDRVIDEKTTADIAVPYGVNALPSIEAAPNFGLFDLAARMQEELGAVQEGRPFHPRVILDRKPDNATLFLNTVEPWTHKTPLVILDAYGDPGIYGRFFGGEVTLHDIAVKLPEHVTIEQVLASTSRNALKEREKDGATVFPLLDKAEKFLIPDIERFRGRKILVYCHKSSKSALKTLLAKRFNLSPVEGSTRDIHRAPDGTEVAFKHYGEDRGDDAFNGYDACILFGTPFPNGEPLADELSALLDATGDPLPLDREILRGKSRLYKDARLNGYIRAAREYEMLQALYRLRPASATIPITIRVYSDLPLSPFIPNLKLINPRETAPWRETLRDTIHFITKKMGFWNDSLLTGGINAVKNNMTGGFPFENGNFTTSLVRVEDLLYSYGVLVKSLISLGKTLPTSFFKKNEYLAVRDEVMKSLGFSPSFVSGHGAMKVWGDVDAFCSFLAEYEVFKARMTTGQTGQEEPAPMNGHEGLPEVEIYEDPVLVGSLRRDQERVCKSCGRWFQDDLGYVAYVDVNGQAGFIFRCADCAYDARLQRLEEVMRSDLSYPGQRPIERVWEFLEYFEALGGRREVFWEG